MERLSDELLIKAYNYAVKLNLSPDFIEQFKKEMTKRGLEGQLIDK